LQHGCTTGLQERLHCCVLAVGGCMNSTCLILAPVVTTGCITVIKTVYTMLPVVPTRLYNRGCTTGCIV